MAASQSASFPSDARGHSVRELLKRSVNMDETTCHSLWGDTQVYIEGCLESTEKFIKTIPLEYLGYCRRICLDVGEHDSRGFFQHDCNSRIMIMNEEMLAMWQINILRRIVEYLTQNAAPHAVIKVLWSCRMTYPCANLSRFAKKQGTPYWLQLYQRVVEAHKQDIRRYREFVEDFQKWKFGPHVVLVTLCRWTYLKHNGGESPCWYQELQERHQNIFEIDPTTRKCLRPWLGKSLGLSYGLHEEWLLQNSQSGAL